MFVRFTADDPGAVFVRERATGAETRYNLLKTAPDKDRLPEAVTPPGLPAARQGYLFERIRPYVRREVRDLVCPRPEGDDFEDLPPAQRRRIEVVGSDEEDAGI